MQTSYRVDDRWNMIVIMSASDFFNALETACPPGSARRVALAPGQALFRQDDTPPGLPFLLKGRIDLVRTTESGDQVRIHIARPQETFAEASIYAERCHCDAVASGPAHLRLLPKARVLRAFETSPDLARTFSQHLATGLMKARRLLELRAITPLTARAHARLSELADAEGALPPGTMLVSLAADLGVTPPALYRALAALERQGKLARPKRGEVRLIRS